MKTSLVRKKKSDCFKGNSSYKYGKHTLSEIWGRWKYAKSEYWVSHAHVEYVFAKHKHLSTHSFRKMILSKNWPPKALGPSAGNGWNSFEWINMQWWARHIVTTIVLVNGTMQGFCPWKKKPTCAADMLLSNHKFTNETIEGGVCHDKHAMYKQRIDNTDTGGILLSNTYCYHNRVQWNDEQCTQNSWCKDSAHEPKWSLLVTSKTIGNQLGSRLSFEI